jgi:hypothetical protein
MTALMEAMLWICGIFGGIPLCIFAAAVFINWRFDKKYTVLFHFEKGTGHNKATYYQVGNKSRSMKEQETEMIVHKDGTYYDLNTGDKITDKMDEYNCGIPAIYAIQNYVKACSNKVRAEALTEQMLNEDNAFVPETKKADPYLGCHPSRAALLAELGAEYDATTRRVRIGDRWIDEREFDEKLTGEYIAP